ncbi:MAG: hypothetical protein WDO17_02920 [Alphaproteobacteria bacterium]
MLTKTLLVAAFVAGSASLAGAVPFDPTLINHDPAPVVDVAARTSAPVRLNDSERTPQSNDAWKLLNRRIPGNAGDASYGGDWDATWGGP